MPDDRRFYLDANFFIEAVEGEGTASENCWRLMSEGEKRPGLLVTSLLTLSEVLVLPLRLQDALPSFNPMADEPLTSMSGAWLGNGTLASEYAALITETPRLSVTEIDRDVLIGAASIRSRWHAGKLPDAIHLAAALTSRCTHFISADKKLEAAASERFGMIPVAPSDLQSLLIDLGAGQ